MKPIAALFVGSLCAVLLSARPAAGGDWLCREAGSVRSGDVIESCGVGEGDTEADARQAALLHAYRELETVCAISARCRPYELEVAPLRTECVTWDDGRRVCYRALRARITAMLRERPRVAPGSGTEQAKAAAAESTPRGASMARQVRELSRLHAFTEGLADSMSAEFFR